MADTKSTGLDLGLFGNLGGDLKDSLGGFVSGATDAAGNALDAAGHAIAYETIMAEMDSLLDNTPLDGVLYDYQSPSPGVMGYAVMDRKFSLKPAGWAVVAAIGGFIAWRFLK